MGESSGGPQSIDKQYLLSWRKITGEKDVWSWHPFFSLVGNFRTESHALERGRQLMGPVLSTLPSSLPLGLACECKVKELNKMVPQPRAGP